MDYFTKVDKRPDEDLDWNIPEQKQGTINIVGGNAQSFRTEIKISEFLANEYPIKTINIVLPNALKSQLPNLPNFVFLESTDSGSFASEKDLKDTLNAADYSLILGDLSKNSITAKAVASACVSIAKPLLITRDTVDIITKENPEKLLMNNNCVFFASLIQLKNLLHAVYYPKMLLMNQSLVQVADILHKFTLTYGVSLITFHNGQILIAKNGNVCAIPLEKTSYSVITIWNGILAGKILAFNLYNPDNFIKATISAIFS